MTSENSGILNRTYRFWKRHRQKAVLVGVAAGGVYAYNNSDIVRDVVDQSWNWLVKKVPLPMELLGFETEDSLLDPNKKQHLPARLRRTSAEHLSDKDDMGISDSQSVVVTCLQLLHGASKLVDELLDVESLRERILKNPSNKLELWDEMKIVAWSRFFASLYTACHLVMYIKIQTGVAGRFLYSYGSESDPDLQRKLQIISRHVQSAEFVVSDGLRQLVKVVKQAVARQVASRSLQDFLSMDDIRDIVFQVRRSMETGTSHGSMNERIYHLEFLVPAELLDRNFDRDVLTSSSEDEALQSLTDDVDNALRSIDCSIILTCCLELCFSRFFKEMEMLMRDKCPERHNGMPPGLPHAALLPAISRMSSLFVRPDESDPVIKELADIQYFQPFINRIVEQKLQQDSLNVR